MRTQMRRMLDVFRGPLRPTILVTGMPKSGTTALAVLLGAAAGFKVNSDPFYRLQMAGVDFRDALFDGALSICQVLREYRHAFRGDVVKDPNFSFFMGELLELFPYAGFVFIVRDPRANIRSILNRVKLPGRPSEAGDQLAKVPSATWGRVLEGRTPDLECGDYIHCAMERWRLTVRAYLEHADNIRLVRYEDFNQDKPQVVKRTLAGLGLAGDRPIEHLMDRQFQPRGDRTISWNEFFGEERVQAIVQACAEEMAAVGYTDQVEA